MPNQDNTRPDRYGGSRGPRGLYRFGKSWPEMRRKPGTDTNFRRSLPEFGCLSQGLPNGTGCPFVVSPKRLSTQESRSHSRYIELWENRGGALWLLDSPSCWRSQVLSSSSPGPAGTRGRSVRVTSPSAAGCRSHLSPIPTTSRPPCCFKLLGFYRGSRVIGGPFAKSLTT